MAWFHLPAYFYSQIAIFYHFNFDFRCFSIYSDEIDIRNRIYASRSIDSCNQNLKWCVKIFFEQLFDFSKTHFIELSFKSNDTIIQFALKTIVHAKYELKGASFRLIMNKSCEITLFGITDKSNSNVVLYLSV